ncbi:MAG TPA: aminoacyl-tRNA hydrolase [Geminicoccaceae bacterium]|nr:aminoacyl-tRNA hydrolase [Geminicoccaceae bacterium]
MLLLVGLGNPEPRYAGHRHNVGFMALDAIARRHGFGSWRNRFSSLICEGSLDGTKVLLQKPQTYVNLSGHAVAQAMRFYKLALQDLVVIHDELDLAPGKLRIKTGGGVAGHNGLRSIAEQLGSRDFRRVRIGIGHPGHKELVTGHVLGNFGADDRAWLEPLLDALSSTAPLLAAGDDAGCMNRIALLLRPPKPPEPGPEPEAGRRREPGREAEPTPAERARSG